MNLRSMQNITAGIPATVDFNRTSFCMRHWLDREWKRNCSRIEGLTDTLSAMLMFFQVRYELVFAINKIIISQTGCSVASSRYDEKNWHRLSSRK